MFEAALNAAMSGAKPLAVVDNLNFGNPEKPEVMWQFQETIEGMSQACEALGIPVVGGNVSFYNETADQDIHPTPVVGLLGLADPMPARPARLDAARSDDELWMFGPKHARNLAGSAYEAVIHDHIGGRPTSPDPVMGAAVVSLAQQLAARSLLPALHDVADGGLAIAVAEMCIASGIGATVQFVDWIGLFAEEPHRFIAAVPSEVADEVEGLAAQAAVPVSKMGTFGGDSISFGNGRPESFSVPLADAVDTWRNAIPSRVG